MRIILFNLYAYRSLREKRKKRRVAAELAVGAVLGLLICLAVGSEFSRRVEEKQVFLGKLSVIEAEVANRAAQVQAMKERVAVLKRQVEALKAVENESVLASRWVSFFDSTVPSDVSLTKLQVTGDLITLHGFTSGVADLARWVDQMEEGNSLFRSVDLVTIAEPKQETSNTVGLRHAFEIKASLRGVNNAPR